MKKHNQNGFSVVEGLLIFIVVAIIGATGYYVWHSKQQTDSVYKSTESSAEGVAKAELSKPKANTDGTFTFKELGINITLPEDLKDLTYSPEQIDSTNGGKATALYFNSGALAKTAADCYSDYVSDGSLSFGAISRSEGQYPENGNATNTDGPLIKQFEKFYIVGSYPNGITICDKPGADEHLVGDMARKLWGELYDAAKESTLAE